MPSTVYDSWVPDLLLLIAVQLGFCILLLAAIATATRGYDTFLEFAGQIVGGVTIGGAVLILVGRWDARTRQKP